MVAEVIEVVTRRSRLSIKMTVMHSPKNLLATVGTLLHKVVHPAIIDMIVRIGICSVTKGESLLGSGVPRHCSTNLFDTCQQ
jgi:hypothetical protein